MSKFSEKFVSVENGNIYTIALGKPSDQIPLLIIHGGPDWDHSYLRSAAKSISKSRRVILFDIRGCGRSTRFKHSKFYSFDLVVEDIKAILDDYKLKVCDLLAFSFGGQIAFQFLNNYGEMVNKFVLASSTAYYKYQETLDNNQEFQARNTKDLQDFLNFSFNHAKVQKQEPSRSIALASLCLDIYNLDKLKPIKKILENINFSGEWLSAKRFGKLSRQKLNPINVLNNSVDSFLILHGEQDMRFPIDVAMELHQYTKNSQLAILKSTGHLAHLEQEEQWVEAVNDYLY